MVHRPRRGRASPARRAPGAAPSRGSCRSPRPARRARAGSARRRRRAPRPGGRTAPRLVGDPPAGDLEPVGDDRELDGGITRGERPRLGPAQEELHVVLEHEAVAAVEVQARPRPRLRPFAPRTRTPSARARPADRRPQPDATRRRAPASDVARSASLCWMLWNDPIGTPNWWRGLDVVDADVERALRQPHERRRGQHPPFVERGAEGAVRVRPDGEDGPLDRLAASSATVGHRGRAEVRRESAPDPSSVVTNRGAPRPGRRRRASTTRSATAPGRHEAARRRPTPGRGAKVARTRPSATSSGHPPTRSRIACRDQRLDERHRRQVATELLDQDGEVDQRRLPAEGEVRARRGRPARARGRRRSRGARRPAPVPAATPWRRTTRTRRGATPGRRTARRSPSPGVTPISAVVAPFDVGLDRRHRSGPSIPSTGRSRACPRSRPPSRARRAPRPCAGRSRR